MVPHLFAMMPTSEPEVFLALALLALLILCTRGQSLLAHGAFAGLFLGYLVSVGMARASWWHYARGIDYVGWGLIFGFLVGGAIRIYLDISKAGKSEEPNLALNQAPKPGPFFWSSAFGVSGAYLALFAAGIFQLPLLPGSSLIMGAILLGTMVGIVFRPVLWKHQRIARFLKLGMGIILLAGIGIIFYWKTL